jgi:hypothetical protein
MIQSARHLHRELPLRLAQRIVDFESQPYCVISNPHFKHVYDQYNEAFDRLRTFPRIQSVDDEQDFTRMVEALVAEHIAVIPTLGKGLSEVKSYIPTDITPFMDRLLMTRISRRVLAEQHIALHGALHHGLSRRGYVGVVRLELTLEEVSDFARAALVTIHSHLPAAAATRVGERRVRSLVALRGVLVHLFRPWTCVSRKQPKCASAHTAVTQTYALKGTKERASATYQFT